MIVAAFASGALVTPQSDSGSSLGYACTQQACTQQHPPETFWDGWSDPVAIATVMLVLATCGLWFTTFKLWQTTAKIAQDTLEDAKVQADKMERSIGEAARAAEAMEGMAASTKTNVGKFAESVGYQETFGQMQMRAYVSVELNGVYQDENHIFEAKPLLRNTGHTPAHSVRWKIAADILPVPLPDDFGFPLPEETTPGGAILGPGQTGFMSAFLDEKKFDERKVPEADLETIKRGDGRGFYTWGIVNYRDAFGVERYTKFAHLLQWHPTDRFDDRGKPVVHAHGQFLLRHNAAD